jgi:cyclohexanecarboxylate-CoA ligase
VIPAELADRYRHAGYWRGETLVDRFQATCTEQAARTALIDGDAQLRFEQAAETVERVAQWLTSMTNPGDVVGWQLPNWWEAVIVHHAAIAAGCVSNPLNPAWRERELRAVMTTSRPAVLAVPESWRGFETLEFAGQLQSESLVSAVVLVRGIARPGVFDFQHLLKVPASGMARRALQPDATAVLLYTSGTTSAPKGVLHTHQSLLCEMDSFPLMHALTPADRYLGGAPLGHIAGLVYGAMTPFALGTSTVLLERWVPGRAIAAISEERATFQTGPPTFLQTLASAARTADLKSFRLFSTGGAAIPTEAARAAAARLGCALKRAYGSTELPTLTATTMDDDERARTETDGRAIGGAEVLITAPDGAALPAGEEGEIWGRAPEMFAGYTDPAIDPLTPDGWFRTGDLGVLDADGLLRVTGRLKDIIIRGGENISATELEDIMSSHPAVADVAVIGVPDERLGERVCAVVVPRSGAALTLDDVVAHLRAHHVATHKLPEQLEVVSSLPRTASGKLAKAAVRASIIGR